MIDVWRKSGWFVELTEEQQARLLEKQDPTTERPGEAWDAEWDRHVLRTAASSVRSACSNMPSPPCSRIASSASPADASLVLK
jgi:hypothetical protein